MSTLPQRSFAGGEIAPALYSRRDMVKYETGLRTCRNFLVQRYGGVQNRPGLEYLAETKDSSKASVLVPFVFNDSQTYVLEFGDLYIRVFKAGEVVESAPSVPYEVVTPYVAADVADLRYVQSGDVITIVHQSYAPRNLTRLADASWTLALASIAPGIDRPTNLARSAYAAGNYTYKYKVTARTADGEEGLPGTIAAQNISAATKANPCVVTYVGTDEFQNGDEILIEGVVGMTELNGNLYVVDNVNAGANTFELSGVNSTNYTAYSSAGTVRKTSITMTAAAVPVVTSRHDLSWTAVSGAFEYLVYCDPNQSGIFGFIGTTRIPSFKNEGITPDTTLTPPNYKNPFNAAGDYPGTVAYFQQRRIYARTSNDPETTQASRTGQFNNFNTSSPVQADDAVSFTMVGRQVNEVRHLLDLGRLVVLTSGGEWGSKADTLTPTDIQLQQYSHYGASTVPPVIIGNNALFIQARGSIVRDLGFDFQVDGYKGNDLTIFSPHLFEGRTVVAWAYAQIPQSIIWAVLDDGALLGLTYVPEQQVWAWHRHDTDGLFESVCVVPEDNEDAVYVIVNRTINGTTNRYVERFYSRVVDEDAQEDMVFLDSAISFDGRNTNTGHTAELSGGTTWERGEQLTLTFYGGATPLAGGASDVGNAVHITDTDGTVYICTIVTAGTTSTCTVTVDKDVPAGMHSDGRSVWAMAYDQFTGLGHLEGEDVSVFADGFVVANPNVDTYTVVTVTAGAVTLPRPYAVVHIGLPYTSDLETLDLETTQGTMVDRKKAVGKLTMMVEKSRGGFYGTETPTSDTIVVGTGGLYEIKQRASEAYADPVSLATEPVDVGVQAVWNNNGRVFVRQSDPLPLTVLSINPAGYFPLGG